MGWTNASLKLRVLSPEVTVDLIWLAFTLSRELSGLQRLHRPVAMALAGKFRCKTCQKLFKATSFVEKHIANKHPDFVKHLQDVSNNIFVTLKPNADSYSTDPLFQ